MIKEQMRIALLSFATFLLLQPTAEASLVTWINSGSGDWATGSNWSSGSPPTIVDDVRIWTGGPVTHSSNLLGGGDYINRLDNDRQLRILNNSTIFAGGRVLNSGGIVADGGHLFQIGDQGVVNFSGGTINVLRGGTFSVNFTGAPTFPTSTFDSEGIVKASGPGSTLTLSTSGVTNLGLVRAENGAVANATGRGKAWLGLGSSRRIENDAATMSFTDFSQIDDFIIGTNASNTDLRNVGVLRSLSLDASSSANVSGALTTITNLDNRGTLRVGSGDSLAIGGTAPSNTITNHGTIEIAGGPATGTLQVYNTTYLEGSGRIVLSKGFGSILGDPGSTLVQGASHTIRGSGEISSGGFSNTGSVLAEGGRGLRFVGQNSIGNTGLMRAAGSGSFISAVGGTIDWIHEGTLEAVAGGRVDIISAGQFFNNTSGVVRAVGPGSRVLLAGGQLANRGTLEASQRGVIDAIGVTLYDFDSNTGRLNGGTYRVLSGGRIELPVDISINNATIVLSGADSRLVNGVYGRSALDSVYSNLGSLTIEGGHELTLVNRSFNFANYGTVRIGAGSLLSDHWGYIQHRGLTQLDGRLVGPLLAFNDGVLSGTGILQGVVDNAAATVKPGNSAGSLWVLGDYRQGPLGTLSLELGGTAFDAYDHLFITGLAMLGGLLDIDLINGFDPEIGDIFQLITFDKVAGNFDRFDLPTLDAGEYWSFLWGDHSLNLCVTDDTRVCRATSPPPPPPPPGVPEPGTLFLLLAAMMAVAMQRRAQGLKSIKLNPIHRYDEEYWTARFVLDPRSAVVSEKRQKTIQIVGLL